MRIRVEYTTDVSDYFRRAVASYYGDEGMATRDQMKQWFRMHGDSMSDDVCREYDLTLEETEADNGR